MMRQRLPFPTFIPLTIGVIAVSFSSIFIVWSSAPAAVIGMYRLLFTAVLMTFYLPKYRRDLVKITRREWGLVILAGIFLGLHFLFWIGSLKLTTVASSMILTALEPLFVVIGAAFVFKEKVTRTTFICMALAFVGIVIVSGGDIGSPHGHLLGDLLSVLGTVAISAQMLFGQSLNVRMPPFVYSFLVFLVAALEMAVYNLVTRTPFTGYPARDWGIFLLLALVPTVFGHALFNWLLKYVNATTISMAILGEPIGAIILAALLLGESVNVYQVVGGLLTILGVLWFLRSNSLHYHSSDPNAVINQ